MAFNDSTAVGNFFISFTGLEELYIKNYETDIDFLWPAIMQHRETLRLLSVHTPRPRGISVPSWSAKQLEELLGSPLKHLEIDMPINELSKVNSAFKLTRRSSCGFRFSIFADQNLF